jgi:uncharacterized membrane protein
MRITNSRTWDLLRTGYWFLPTAMAVGSVGLAYGLGSADRALGETRLWWALAVADPEGARELLSTCASCAVTFAGVAFSITIVALALAASQLGSKVLRTFMRDPGSQVAVGAFVASFIYSLLVLRTTRGRNGAEDAFVPALSATLALVLTVSSVGMLVYFLHHVATIIQVEHVVSEVALDLRTTIEQVYSEEGDRRDAPPGDDPVPSVAPRGPCARITSPLAGYLQMIDEEAVLKTSVAGDFSVRILHRPGEFIPEGMVLAEVSPADAMDRGAARELRSAFSIGRYRTIVQDIEFGIDQLVQIAIRALSPGINDTLTAISCMNWLEAALRTLGRRKAPLAELRDERGQARVVVRWVTPGEIADAAFHPLRRASRSNAAAAFRLLGVLAAVGEVCLDSELRRALRHHADLVAREAEEGLPSEGDRVEAARRYRAAVVSLAGHPGG